jgi:hypothetical protein
MDKATLLEDVLGDFAAPQLDPDVTVRYGRPVTVWLPHPYKVKYDMLQIQSGKRLSKKARELLMALIDLAEKRVA